MPSTLEPDLDHASVGSDIIVTFPKDAWLLRASFFRIIHTGDQKKGRMYHESQRKNLFPG